MAKLPAYFLSHGSPDLLIREAPAAIFLKDLSIPVKTARAILVISAHWETDIPSITGNQKPETIHDFYGFPQELYDIRYQVNGSREIAQEICDMLQEHNINAKIDKERGLDHGAWMPLCLAVPNCNIPVLQLSIQPHESAEYHYNIGKALRMFRDNGIIIIASGNITHNIRAALQGNQEDGQKYAEAFDEWINNALTKRIDDDLLHWKQKAPHAKWNHPTDDHILPLFVILGASESEQAKRIHQSYDYNVLSMASYVLS